MILAVLLDGDGRPVCTEMWPGNTAIRAAYPDRLCKRFAVRRVCVVADRGMIVAETMTNWRRAGSSRLVRSPQFISQSIRMPSPATFRNVAGSCASSLGVLEFCSLLGPAGCVSGAV